jgi:hypothetical protein
MFAGCDDIADILNKTFLALLFRSDICCIYFSFIFKSSIYDVFRFVSLRDSIFILYLFMTWPEYYTLYDECPAFLMICRDP